jgi:hypothetical protein
MVQSEAKTLEEQDMDREPVIVVSGLPRSGTSMMMKMLEAGGMQVVTDNIRTADEDNPKGYYEFERVKQIEHDKAWLPDAQGKAIKMIATLLRHLPLDYCYEVLFMERKIEEVLASQRQMLIRRGEPTDAVSDEKMGELFDRHVERVKSWLDEQPNMKVLYVSYNNVVASPLEQSKRIDQFLSGALDTGRMASVIDPGLYRQRG